MTLFEIHFIPLLLLVALSVPQVTAREPESKSQEPHLDPQPIQWVNCSDNVPEALYSEYAINPFFTETLPGTLKCGRLDVPLDYAKEFDEKNNISIAFSLYTPPNPVGTIFYNPGGPGAEVQSEAWHFALNSSRLFSGLEDFELMMMDPRGTHASSPLNHSYCLTEYDVDPFPFGPPKDQNEFEAYRKTSKAVSEKCLKHSGELMKFVGSHEAVLDWESIRIALDRKTVSLLGVSYGTHYFTQYIKRFPASIHLAVLDAPMVHGKSDIGTIIDEAVALSRMLSRADAYCQSNSTCPFYSQGKGAVIDGWNEVLARAKAGDLAVTKQNASTTATINDIQYGSFWFLKGVPSYDDFLQAMAGTLFQNNATIMLPEMYRMADLPPPLVCPDDYIEDNSLRGSQAIEGALASLDLNNIHPSIIWQVKLDCSNWPVHGRKDTSWENIQDFPILWVTSDFDANTPTEWANFNHDRTPNSTLVVRHGDAHGSLWPVGPARDIIIQYLRTGQVFASSNETLVTVYHPGMTRNATQIPDPYLVGFDVRWVDEDLFPSL
ncbi:hypothetical protein DL96DRAFT_1617263 [Flagelloscypha sp. PMI_526]|nr:hypothetical protein DL96DRAFT_1617263 [Flagelloscypha sp. PMI_526]